MVFFFQGLLGILFCQRLQAAGERLGREVEVDGKLGLREACEGDQLVVAEVPQEEGVFEDVHEEVIPTRDQLLQPHQELVRRGLGVRKVRNQSSRQRNRDKLEHLAGPLIYSHLVEGPKLRLGRNSYFYFLWDGERLQDLHSYHQISVLSRHLILVGEHQSVIGQEQIRVSEVAQAGCKRLIECESYHDLEFRSNKIV